MRDRIVGYERRGAGAPVVLLRSPGAHEQLWSSLADVLAASYRVILPELPETNAACAGWLSDFLEGLGATGVRLVVSPEFRATAVELALINGDAFVGAVVVSIDSTDAPEKIGDPPGISRSWSEFHVPTLVVPGRTGEESAAASISRFLGSLASQEGAARGY